MRRWLVVLLILAVAISMVACGQGEKTEEPLKTAEAEYVGIWKATVKTGLVDGVAQYDTYTIELKSDGTGSYRDKKGTWECSSEDNKIVLTLTDEKIGVVLEIGETEGKPTLKYYQDIYYRESDYISP